MKKWYKLCILFLISLLSFTLLFACKKDEDDTPDEPETPSVETEITPLYLRKTNISMLLGDETELAAVYTEQAGKTLAYASDNAAVATVSQDGVVEAMGVGTAKITVTYGEETATCNIAVATEGKTPTMAFEETIDGDIVTLKEETVNLGVVALFNGKTFDDVDVEYAYSDESVGEVDENGLFVPAKTGTTTVTIVGTWRGQTNALMEKTVTITVKAGTKALVNGGQSDLSVYTVASHGGKSYETSMPFAISVTEDDGVTPVTGWTVSVVEGEELLEYDNGVVTSKGKYGKAVVGVSGNDEAHGEIYHEFTVEIVRPVAESAYEGNLDAKEGSLDLDAMTKIFGTADTKVYDAYSENVDLRVENGMILGFTQTENVAPTAQRITVYNDEVGYEISVKVYAGVIRTVADFAKFRTAPVDVNATKDNTATLTGYFVLANDIDATGQVAPVNGKNIISRSWDEFKRVGFKGVFDGLGHTVSNYDAAYCGVFGLLGQGSVVKNVAFTDVTINAYAEATLAGWTYGTTLENVYISVKALNTNQTAVVACNLDATSKLNNCVFEVKSFTKPSGAYGVMGYMLDGRAPKDPAGWTNTYIIAPNVADQSSYGYVVDCQYVDGVATGIADSEEYVNLTGVKRYTSWEKFIEDAEANEAAVSGFDGAYWNTDCGVPVWGMATKLSVVKIGNVVAQSTTELHYATTNKMISVVGTGESNISVTATKVSGDSVNLSSSFGGRILTTVALGQSVIRVTYTYDGETIVKDITINVVKPVSTAYVTVNGEEKRSITLSPLGDTNKATFALVGGTGTLSVLSGEEILEVNGMEATVVSGGFAVVRISWTENGFEYYTDVDVLSLPEVEDKTDITVDFDASKGTFTADDLKTIFGENETDTTIVYATLDGEAMTVTDGAIFGFELENEPVATEIVVITGTRAIRLNVKPYARIFRTADDFFYTAANGVEYSYFDMTDKTRWEATRAGNPKIAGAFLLAGDIDMTDETRVVGHRWGGWYDDDYDDYESTVAGFVGVFDGQGHTITGMTVGRGGIFGSIGEGTIKNLALVDVKFTQATENANYSFIFGQFFSGYTAARHAKVQNVYVSVKQAQLPYSATAPAAETKAWDNGGMLAYRTSQYSTFENFVVDLSQLGDINVVGRGLFSFGSASQSLNNMTNTFVISKGALILGYGGSHTSDGNVGIIHDAANKKDVDWTGKQLAWIYKTIMLDIDTTQCTYGNAGGVYRFDTATEMKTYIETNEIDLSGFDAELWNTANGVPEWK